MALVRWDPDPFKEMNRLLSSFLDVSAENGGGTRRWVPAMDLAETAEHFVLRADLPGLSEEDVAIEVEDRILTISGERKLEREEHDGGYHRRERSYGAFARSLTLPDGVDPERVEATFDKGVLEVRIPKPEQRKPRRIHIGAGDQKTIEGSASA